MASLEIFPKGDGGLLKDFSWLTFILYQRPFPFARVLKVRQSAAPGVQPFSFVQFKLSFSASEVFVTENVTSERRISTILAG